MSRAAKDTPQRGFFPATPWSLISRIRNPAHPEDQKVALNELCGSYWPAVYAFIRYQGHSPSDAEDLTQDFLCRIIAKELLKDATAEQGRLRTLLSLVLKRFLIDHHRHDCAEKRGGNQTRIAIDISTGEDYLARLGGDHASPERFFDQAFAANLMDRTINQLRGEYDAQGRVHVFDVLKPSLLGDMIPGEIKLWAENLEASQGTVRVAIHRLRKRFRETFRKVVLETVVNPDDLDEELTALLEASS